MVSKVLDVTKKPITVQAFAWVGYMGDAEDLKNFLGYIPVYNGSIEAGFSVEISTLEGVMTASPGDYIVRGVQGEFYPVKPDIFHQTYEWGVKDEVQPAPVQSA